jgi:deoxyribose-phosphate aldolase
MVSSGGCKRFDACDDTLCVESPVLGSRVPFSEAGLLSSYMNLVDVVDALSALIGWSSGVDLLTFIRGLLWGLL